MDIGGGARRLGDGDALCHYHKRMRRHTPRSQPSPVLELGFFVFTHINRKKSVRARTGNSPKTQNIMSFALFFYEYKHLYTLSTN